jgi:hypothetical protein
MLQPRPFRDAAGERHQAALVVDVVIAPGHRSALTLIQLLRAQMQAGDFELLIHTSNETSDPIYRKLLRYPVAFELKAFGLPLRSGNAVRKLWGRSVPGIDVLTAAWRGGLLAAAMAGRAAARLSVAEGLPPGEVFESIMAGFRRQVGPHFDRSLDFLRWRFSEGPLFSGTLATLRIGGTPRGYLAWRTLELEGMTFFVLMDVALSSPLRAGERWALWLELARRAGAAGADLLFVMLNPGNPLLASLAGPPLLAIPDRLLPHPSPIFVHARSPALEPLRESRSTYLTLADIDYF